MNTVLQNGRQQPQTQQRKQLSDQLDRFDQILDGLAEGLNGAMADAAREGTRLAVKDAIVEILTNPELRAAIQGAVPTPAPAPVAAAPARSAWMKLKNLLRRTRAALAGAVMATRTFIARKISATAAVAVGAGKVTVAAWRVKRAVLATVVAGVAVGAGAYYAAPHAGAVLSAAAGAFVAVSVRTAIWVRSALRPFLPA